MRRQNGIRFVCAALLGIAGWVNVACAQQAQTPKASAKAPPSLQDLLLRLSKVERELERLKVKQGLVPAEKKDQKIQALLETLYLGSTYQGSSNEMRFFAARLILVNLTPQAVTVTREQIALEADGTIYKLGDIPPEVQFQSFQVGNQGFQLNNLQPAKQLRLPAGGTAATWVVFADLPRGNHIPKLKLKMNIAGKKSELSVNEFALGLLGLDVERIGPRGSLGLLTISGAINTVNVGNLVDAMDSLTAQKVVRVVIRWTNSAAPLDSQLQSWLENAARQAGRGQVSNSRFPVVPVTIRELHLAQVPNQNATSSHPNSPRSYSSSSSGPPRIHKTAAEAVSAALESAYRILPRTELLKEIEHGHPLTRAAALAAGGGRLTEKDLPQILQYADADDPPMQRAALTALRHFGERQAIDKLLVTVRKNAEPLSSVAIESLAASRYADAHHALLEVLKNETPASKKNIVKVLAHYPRPIWSETIYRFTQDPDPEVVIEALRALARVGHPKLIDVLEQSLGQADSKLRDEAFNILVSRTDSRSEDLAMNYTLEYLKKSAPTSPQMYSLLKRTKDRRALPLLLKHFDQSQTNRLQIIDALSHIGDQEVTEIFVKNYPRLSDNEKSAVLNVLLQMRSPAFRKLAGQALETNNSSLISAACRGLQSDGSSEAVRLLTVAFEKSGNSNTWSYISNALATLATPQAEAALRKARDSGNETKRNYANNALRMLRQRLPGYQYVSQAQRYGHELKWKEAIEQYNVALDLNSQLPEAYAGRASILLKQNKPKDAHKDFTKALELDPYSSAAVTGLGTVLVLEGKCEAGIKYVEDARGKFKNDMFFAYNTACVYGRALEHVRKNEKTTDRDKKLKSYQQKAVAELKRSVKLGFRDFNWMKKDPDLKSLHELSEFKQIHAP